MSDSYAQLLDAVISHLEEMKTRGIAYIGISSDTIAGLKNLSQKPASRKAISPGPPKERLPIASPISLRASHPTPPAASETLHANENRALSNLPLQERTVPAMPHPDPAAKAAAFAELRQRAMACAKCEHLASSRKNVVFGVGNISSELMFVGEAPGADEDAQAEPFVGRAGQLLTKIIETMGLTRDSVYIANILKCRPDTPGQPTGNRKPTLEEMHTCIPFLHEQIDLIQPKVIVALGGTAVEGLLGKTAGITRLRGTWQSYRNIPLMPTYHPAYLLRNQGPMEKRRVWEDMLQVMEKLGMPISDKQRNFFTKGP
jgi:DNA polymerase